MEQHHFNKHLSNNNAIILLTVYAAVLFVNNMLGNGWFVKSSSLVDELFYFGVTCWLALRNLTESDVWNRKRYKVMLGANFALAIIGIYDALIVAHIKANYLFISYSVEEFGEVEQQIDSFDAYMSGNFLVWTFVLGSIFGFGLCKISNYIREQS